MTKKMQIRYEYKIIKSTVKQLFSLNSYCFYFKTYVNGGKEDF